jgi:hypothetical protein
MRFYTMNFKITDDGQVIFGNAVELDKQVTSSQMDDAYGKILNYMDNVEWVAKTKLMRDLNMPAYILDEALSVIAASGKVEITKERVGARGPLSTVIKKGLI